MDLSAEQLMLIFISTIAVIISLITVLSIVFSNPQMKMLVMGMVRRTAEIAAGSFESAMGAIFERISEMV